MQKVFHVCAFAFLTCLPTIVAVAADRLSWPSTLPVYDHIVIVVEENKDFEEIFGGKFNAPAR
jgi:phospholipase C